MKKGKKYLKASELVDRIKDYELDEAVDIVKKTATAKFDETVELATRLGVDLRHADQAVRGAVSLPNGTGKSQIRVLVFAQGDKATEAQNAGADYVGGEEFTKKITEGWLEFEAVIATPDMMRSVAPLGRILGPRGLMPSPRAGTVTMEIGSMVKEIKAGRLEWSPSTRIDREGAVLHVPVGKASFTNEQLKENILAMIDAIMKVKPSAAKGRYLRSASISCTMGPGIKLDTQNLINLLEG
ncbi:MAG: ribosomal protein [Candidatus Poribacteria bacterium]|nr:ribosomal protein [Candidatus Poribacteria bacterium]MDQ1327348.1 ribosomal protein [Candidatus Poribacteria bacterium]